MGGGRRGRAHARTHGRTPARRLTALRNYHSFKLKKHQYALRFSVFGSSCVENSLEKLRFFHYLCAHGATNDQYALRFSVFGSWNVEKALENLAFFIIFAFMGQQITSTHYVFHYLGAGMLKNHQYALRFKRPLCKFN